MSRADALVSEVESLQWSSEWKTAGDRIRALIDQYKQLQREPFGVYDSDRRDVQSSMWSRLMAARSTFHQRRREHFDQLDRLAEVAASRKRGICDEAERLASSTDWKATAAAFKALNRRWKAAGSARGAEDALWTRYRMAQDRFFDARRRASEDRVDELKDLAVHLDEARNLGEERLVDAARTVLDAIQELGTAVLPQDHDAALRLRKECHSILEVTRHPHRVRQWIALAQLDAYVYEAGQDGDRALVVQAETEARALRQRLERSTSGKKTE